MLIISVRWRFSASGNRAHWPKRGAYHSLGGGLPSGSRIGPDENVGERLLVMVTYKYNGALKPPNGQNDHFPQQRDEGAPPEARRQGPNLRRRHPRAD